MSGIVNRDRSMVKHERCQLRRTTADKGLAARCQIVLLCGEGNGCRAVVRAAGLATAACPACTAGGRTTAR